MKRLNRLLLGAFCTGMLVSCASSEGANGETTITLWYWHRALDDQVIKDVEAKFPGVKINAQKVGGEYKTKLHTALIAGNGPDIVAMNDWASEYLQYSDKFVNLNEYDVEEIKDDYLDWKWNLAIDPETDTMIALPIDTGPTVLYYRADLFEEAGLPSEPDDVAEQIDTWDAYVEAGEQMKDRTGVFMFDNLLRTYLQNIEQQPDKYFTTDEEYIGDGGSVREAWDMTMKVNELQLTPRIADGERNAALNNGSIASFIGAVWEANILKDAAPDTAGEWRITAAPGGAGNNGGSFLGVLESTEDKDLAVEITKALVSTESQKEHYLGVELFPSTIETIESEDLYQPDPFFGDQVVMEVYAEAAKDVPLTYYGNLYGPLRSYFEDELTLVERGNKDPDAAWEDVQTKISRELSRQTNE
ncbi:ABC transporter substrate-binding protein [Alkalicoccobacillus gibsonii]|uniref:ABC transporter substrate-binding protein n=1 Tax=Alkalicoccobacillus gibsonii TaxID=79881 RepID=UPI0035195963